MTRRRDAGRPEFEDFVAVSQPALRRTAYLLCGDWQLASDYVQEGLIRVYRRWPRLERDGRLHAYAKRAVVSAALDARRRRSSTELVSDTSVTGAGTVPDHAAPSSERMALLEALATLPTTTACLRGAPLLRGPAGRGGGPDARHHRGHR